MALLTSVAAESEMLVTVLVAKLAVSFDPFGIVAGVQFAALFQFPVSGVAFHLALPALVGCSAASRNTAGRSAAKNADWVKRTIVQELVVVRLVFMEVISFGWFGVLGESAFLGKHESLLGQKIFIPINSLRSLNPEVLNN